MTCIVGLKTPKCVLIGGDACAGNSATYSRFVCKHPKVFYNGPFLIGYTSSFRMGQILEYEVVLPEPEPKDLRDLTGFMVRRIIPKIRKAFKDHGFLKIESNYNEEGGSFLIAYQKHLFEIQANFHVMEVKDKFAAIGCGADVALGAIKYALSNKSSHPPKPFSLIQKVLKTVSHFSGFVCPPFTVHSTRNS